VQAAGSANTGNTWLGAYDSRPDCGPIAAKTITYTPQQVYYTYCFSHPPACRAFKHRAQKLVWERMHLPVSLFSIFTVREDLDFSLKVSKTHHSKQKSIPGGVSFSVAFIQELVKSHHDATSVFLL
jgi:hypothetical protein